MNKRFSLVAMILMVSGCPAPEKGSETLLKPLAAPSAQVSKPAETGYRIQSVPGTPLANQESRLAQVKYLRVGGTRDPKGVSLRVYYVVNDTDSYVSWDGLQLPCQYSLYEKAGTGKGRILASGHQTLSSSGDRLVLDSQGVGLEYLGIDIQVTLPNNHVVTGNRPIITLGF